MPTGVALRDAREQLFAAAERVLLRDGPNGLTSRSVTAEAGVAKGVLHRHFPDFDAFLAELVLDRIGRLDELALREAAGTGSVTDNLTAALTDVFGPVAVAIVGLVTFRDGLRARLRQAGLPGIPLLAQAAALIAAYLAAERDLGRIAADADPDTIALTLIGSAHLLFAGRDDPPPADEIRRIVAAVVTPAG
ncbi:TetR/AcrR family transcriptional regulator [Pseudonocardia cypriaca]|uniref:TetR family transcriptional regulator n=1 Tax=Pseudonocardia cypriaca TaxID=882449 RepID=A0A543FRL2_9PSEU|nr:TetR/AcrR family transcriptional regulator [Pseudonocardia cypriaca]TQM36476.1 TetR family transcriptional regulator [Pseudonocardia cypriaca]